MTDMLNELPLHPNGVPIRVFTDRDGRKTVVLKRELEFAGVATWYAEALGYSVLEDRK